MAKKYLKRRFSVRETILLCVLLAVLLVGLYFGLVFYPIQSRTQDVNTELENVKVQKEVATGLKAEYDMMKAELDRIEANHDNTTMPESTGAHATELRNKIDDILEGIPHSYSTSVQAPQDGIVKRTVSLSFTVTEENKGAENTATVYETVRSLLTEIITMEYRCSLNTFSLSPQGQDLQHGESISVVATIEFFELSV